MKENINLSNLSRKDLLLQYKQQKLNGQNKTETSKTVEPSKGIRPCSMQSKLKTSTTGLTKVAIQPIDHKKVKDAGTERVGPGTPVAKIKDRIKKALQPTHTDDEDCIPMVSLNSSICGSVKPSVTFSASELSNKIDEGKMLAKISGIDIARKYFEEIPLEDGMSSICEHSVYWLAWIQVESDAGELEMIKKLYQSALLKIQGKAAVKAVEMAHEKFCAKHGLNSNITDSDGRRSSEQNDIQSTVSSIPQITTSSSTQISTDTQTQIIASTDSGNGNENDNDNGGTQTTRRGGGRGGKKKCVGVFQDVEVSKLRQTFEKNNKQQQQQHLSDTTTTTTTHGSGSGDTGVTRTMTMAMAMARDLETSVASVSSSSVSASNCSYMTSFVPVGGVPLPGMTAPTPLPHQTSTTTHPNDVTGGGLSLSLSSGVALDTLLGLLNPSNEDSTYTTTHPSQTSTRVMFHENDSSRRSSSRSNDDNEDGHNAPSSTSKWRRGGGGGGGRRVTTPFAAAREHYSDDDSDDSEGEEEEEEDIEACDAITPSAAINTAINSSTASLSAPPVSSSALQLLPSSEDSSSSCGRRGTGTGRKRTAAAMTEEVAGVGVGGGVGVRFCEEENEKESRQTQTQTRDNGGSGGRGRGDAVKRRKGTPKATKVSVSVSISNRPSSYDDDTEEDAYGHFFLAVAESSGPVRRSRRLSSDTLEHISF
eukprot:gene6423-12986_t